MLNNMKFSIIIPVYNGANVLPDTLRSIHNQDCSDYELIVVDDGSTIELGSNNGPATARNRGGREAQGDILLFTDSDVLLPKNTLTSLAQTYIDQSCDAVQGTFSEVCPFPNYFSQYKNLYNRFVLNQLPDWIDTTFTSITAVKKTAFMACGGFDEHIRTASVEDRTLGRHLRQSGSTIFLNRSLEVVHNKQLTLLGFLRNQYRRSKDLAKLLLRNRQEKQTQNSDGHKPLAENARFGTNAMTTMMRIPVAYGILALLALSCAAPILLYLALLFCMLYVYLIFPFECYLFRKRGLGFALKGIMANGIDALFSGIGIGVGVIEFVFLKKKY